jgi:hypothetical protein
MGTKKMIVNGKEVTPEHIPVEQVKREYEEGKKIGRPLGGPHYTTGPNRDRRATPTAASRWNCERRNRHKPVRGN